MPERSPQAPLLIHNTDGVPANRFAEALQREAEACLSRPRYSVVDKDVVPPGGDKHDWMNLADYMWPNPDSEDGLPWVSRDGEANPEARRYDRRRFNAFLLAVLRLAAAWRLRRRAEFADKAAALLRAWFLEPDTAMHPNLRFAHYVPGTGAGRKDGLIVFCAALPSLLDAWLLLHGSGFVDDAAHAAMRAWCAELLDWLQTDPMSLDHARIVNNHGTYHAMLDADLLLFLDRRDEARTLLAGALDRALGSQVASDGAQPHETGRTLSAQYSMFNLRALMSLARLGEHVGLDGWRRPAGAPGIREAAAYLHRHASGEARWPHPQLEPPNWWLLEPLCRAANRVYGDVFDCGRIDSSAAGVSVPPEPAVFTEGWELIFAPSHRQHLPLPEATKR